MTCFIGIMKITGRFYDFALASCSFFVINKKNSEHR